jgi:hypothetical protein
MQMFPKFIKIKQALAASKIDDIAAETKKAINSLGDEALNAVKGKRIGITAGSRGINGIPQIIATVVSAVREHGGEPIVVAAMGSHGGATAEGQREMLESLGISESTVGAPILCNADAVQVGSTAGGIPVYCNSEAAKLDGLIICNRVKSHTDFSGDIESGLCKMMTIGLGNHKGASTAHFYAVNNGYPEMIRESAEVMMANLPVLFGVGIVENWKNETMLIQAALTPDIISMEMELLKAQKEGSLKLPFKEVDVLVVGELGKNISGAGMDTKVIGRIRILGQKEPDDPNITNIVVLGLTAESHGNAVGIGLADYTTMEVFRQIDIPAMTINGLTSMSPDQIKLPVILDTQKEAIEWACRTLGPAKEDHFSMAYIENTMCLETIAVSENIIDSLEGNIEILSEPFEPQFDGAGKLVSPVA